MNIACITWKSPWSKQGLLSYDEFDIGSCNLSEIVEEKLDIGSTEISIEIKVDENAWLCPYCGMYTKGCTENHCAVIGGNPYPDWGG